MKHDEVDSAGWQKMAIDEREEGKGVERAI